MIFNLFFNLWIFIYKETLDYQNLEKLEPRFDIPVFGSANILTDEKSRLAACSKPLHAHTNYPLSAAKIN